jgi:MoxR-like ATPase
MNMTQIFLYDYTGKGLDPSRLKLADTPPPWRTCGKRPVKSSKPKAKAKLVARQMSPWQVDRGSSYLAEEREASMVDASLMLRRPLLVTGNAGVGKSSLAYSVAWQLGLGNVLRWNITSRSTLKEALYEYDAVSRLHDVALKEKSKGNPEDIGSYVTLGPLGTALLPNPDGRYFPRVLLIDEIDKADADLPSDLLHVLEEGSFEVSEIVRHNAGKVENCEIAVRTIEGNTVQIPASGQIAASDFPLVIMTSNGERDFPAAFKRRCLPLEIFRPKNDKLISIVARHLGEAVSKSERVAKLISDFSKQGESALLATDQLLSAIHLLNSLKLEDQQWNDLRENIWRGLNDAPNLDAP